jgi:hypothetical protein
MEYGKALGVRRNRWTDNLCSRAALGEDPQPDVTAGKGRKRRWHPPLSAQTGTGKPQGLSERTCIISSAFSARETDRAEGAAGGNEQNRCRAGAHLLTTIAD